MKSLKNTPLVFAALDLDIILLTLGKQILGAQIKGFYTSVCAKNKNSL